MRDVWEAMSDKTRREILVMLKERNLSAGEIAEKFSLTKATVSHHLSVLRQAGLVDTEKRAQTVIYSLNLTVFQSFLLAVNGLFADKDFKGSRKAETTAPFGALRSGSAYPRLYRPQRLRRPTQLRRQ